MQQNTMLNPRQIDEPPFSELSTLLSGTEINTYKAYSPKHQSKCRNLHSLSKSIPQQGQRFRNRTKETQQ